jgi:hypothetical protein
MDVALEIFSQSGATLHPVAAVKVFEALDRPDFSSVDVAANNALDSRLTR